MNDVLARLDAMPDGRPVDAEATIDDASESLILIRAGPHVDAFPNVCPQAGRRLDWAPGQFLVSRDGHLVCAAHGASFELRSGLCVAGPCRGESLRRVDVSVDDSTVRLAR